MIAPSEFEFPHYTLFLLLFIFCVSSTDILAGGQPPRALEPALPAEWLVCAQDKDCTFIPFDCSGRAASNRIHSHKARAAIYKVRHDPTVIDCSRKETESAQNQTPVQVKCKNSRCSLQ